MINEKSLLKALFAPADNKANDNDVLDLIKKRSNIKTAASTYS